LHDGSLESHACLGSREAARAAWESGTGGDAPRIAYVIPTRNRLARLCETLGAIGSLPDHDAEVVVVDNASDPPAACPRRLDNGIGVSLLRRSINEGAAARNIGAAATDPGAAWIVMLDDDSYPVSVGWLEVLGGMPGDVAAVSGDIHLPGQGCRERGGLPEVFIGCGVAIRREAFLYAGGYDPAFGYYAEEYDLSARLIGAGARIVFEPTFRVEHHKVLQGRDMDLILGRLVRNNGWVVQRHAPESVRRETIRAVRARYREIAASEGAGHGYGLGLVELRATIRAQRRAPLRREGWDRFVGIAAAREALGLARRGLGFESAALIEPGKHAEHVVRALEELGVRVTDPRRAEALVIGTLSPGPMLDAAERIGARDEFGRPVLMAWHPGGWDRDDSLDRVSVAARGGAARTGMADPRAA